MRFGSRGDNMAAMKSDDIKYARMEGASDTLYPGASTSDNVLRLGFIRCALRISSNVQACM
jgi:hypothetical protein